MRRFLAPLIALLAVHAAAQSVAPRATDATSLQVGRWLVAEFGEEAGAEAPPPPMTARGAPHLSFSAGGRVSGFGGCNLIGGRMGAAASEIRIEVAPLTRRRCGAAADVLERRLIATLNAATGYVAENGAIILRNEAGDLMVLSRSPRRRPPVIR